jgi:hypothetical protein
VLVWVGGTVSEQASSAAARPTKTIWWPQRDSTPCFVAVTFSPAVSHTSQRQALFNDDATKTFNVRDGWETVVLLVQIGGPQPPISKILSFEVDLI